MLISFARHEPAAASAAQRAAIVGSRSRFERWLRLPVPRPYVPPKMPAPEKKAPASEANA
jgi:cell division protein FtsW